MELNDDDGGMLILWETPLNMWFVMWFHGDFHVISYGCSDDLLWFEMIMGLFLEFFCVVYPLVMTNIAIEIKYLSVYHRVHKASEHVVLDGSIGMITGYAAM